VKDWEIIADNLSKAGEKQIASQTPEPWASGVWRGGLRHCRFEYRLPGGRMARSIPENQKCNLSYLADNRAMLEV